MSQQIAEFLLVRIAEDEETARWVGSIQGESWSVSQDDDGYPLVVVKNEEEQPVLVDVGNGSTEDRRECGVHIARWDPARVLAECDAKRRRVERLRALAALCPEDDWPDEGGVAEAVAADLARSLLCYDALPYADHRDYREEWRP